MIEQTINSLYMVTNKTAYTKLTSTHIGSNYATVMTSSGQDYITNWTITASIKNPLIQEYSPPPADGLQYEVDRQAQLRAYAQSISFYQLGLYCRKQGQIFLRKIIPLYKYFPDHQIDLFPLLWQSAQGILEEGEELLLKFESSPLPAAEDSILSVINYFTLNTTVVTTWFSVVLPALTEVAQTLPDGCYQVTFKQIKSPTSKLYYSFAPTGYRDELNIDYERTELISNNKSIFFFCEQPTTVLIKALSI
jgi:hypothetical protein